MKVLEQNSIGSQETSKLTHFQTPKDSWVLPADLKVQLSPASVCWAQSKGLALFLIGGITDSQVVELQNSMKQEATHFYILARHFAINVPVINPQDCLGGEKATAISQIR